jgi:hypothetical protein
MAKMRSYIYQILGLALDGRQWPVSCHGCFNPQERAHGNNWLGEYVTPTARKKEM